MYKGTENNTINIFVSTPYLRKNALKFLYFLLNDNSRWYNFFMS